MLEIGVTPHGNAAHAHATTLVAAPTSLPCLPAQARSRLPLLYLSALPPFLTKSCLSVQFAAACMSGSH